MDVELFARSPAGRLVRVGEGADVYWGFVPARLPPELPLIVELMRAESEAAFALGELAALGPRIRNPHLFISELLVVLTGRGQVGERSIRMAV